MVCTLGILPSLWLNLSVQYSDCTIIDLDRWINASGLRVASPLWQNRKPLFKHIGLCFYLLNLCIWLRIHFLWKQWGDWVILQHLIPLKWSFSAWCVVFYSKRGEKISDAGIFTVLFLKWNCWHEYKLPFSCCVQLTNPCMEDHKSFGSAPTDKMVLK